MTDPVSQHYASENEALLNAWGRPDAATARARFNRIVDYGVSRHKFTESEARNCSDHRLILMAEEAMLREQAEEQLRRVYRGELQLPAPPPTVQERLASVKNDFDRATIIDNSFTPGYFESTDRNNQDDVIARLERQQGITR